MKTHKLILGSKSPRRSFLLGEGNIDFEVYTLEVDEDYDPSMSSEMVPEYLANKKVKEIFEAYGKDHSLEGKILLSADSVVVLDGAILGKPVDRRDAIETIRRMSDKLHYVYTGVAFKSLEKLVSYTVVTEVLFDALSLEEIEWYIDTFEPFDKAGSYGIQDWIGYCKIKSIKGSYSNVMGLPMNEVYHTLKNW